MWKRGEWEGKASLMEMKTGKFNWENWLKTRTFYILTSTWRCTDICWRPSFQPSLTAVIACRRGVLRNGEQCLENILDVVIILCRTFNSFSSGDENGREEKMELEWIQAQKKIITSNWKWNYQKSVSAFKAFPFHMNNIFSLAKEKFIIELFWFHELSYIRTVFLYIPYALREKIIAPFHFLEPLVFSLCFWSIAKPTSSNVDGRNG